MGLKSCCGPAHQVFLNKPASAKPAPLADILNPHMPKLSDIRNRILQKIVSDKIPVPDPTFELVMDADGEFEDQRLLSIKEVESILENSKSEEDIVTFLKKYLFHINYSGNLISPSFLESLLDGHTLAVYGLFTRPSELEYEIHSDLNIAIGNAAVRIFSRRVRKFELYLFDQSNIHFISSSGKIESASIACRNESELRFNAFCDRTHFHCLDSSKAQIYMNSFQFYSDIVAHNNATVDVSTADHTHSWIRIFEDAKCNIKLSGDSFVRMFYDNQDNIDFTFVNLQDTKTEFSGFGPVYVDEVQNKIYTPKTEN